MKRVGFRVKSEILPIMRVRYVRSVAVDKRGAAPNVIVRSWVAATNDERVIMGGRPTAAVSSFVGVNHRRRR